MRIEFNRAGAERKAFVAAAGEILGVKPKYLGMPTAAYAIGNFTITKDGALEFDDSISTEEAGSLLEQLAEQGFEAETEKAAQGTEAAVPADGAGEGPQRGIAGLTVAVPLDKVNAGRLTSLLDAKGSLIRKALGIEETPVRITEEEVSFPWFAETPEPEAVKAYTHLISALCRMSVNQKRITAKEKAVENEKYAFRCFLLRLGFIGAEYKEERKILLKNLEGSSAFKSGTGKGADSDGVSGQGDC